LTVLTVLTKVLNVMASLVSFGRFVNNHLLVKKLIVEEGHFLTQQ